MEEDQTNREPQSSPDRWRRGDTVCASARCDCEASARPRGCGSRVLLRRLLEALYAGEFVGRGPQPDQEVETSPLVH